MPKDKGYIDKAQKDFFDNHITRKEVGEILNTGEAFINNGGLTKIKIPDGLSHWKYYRIYMFSKREVYDIKKHNDFILENCISTNDAVKYLGICKATFWKDVKEFNIESKQRIGFKRIAYYFEDDIEIIKAKRDMSNSLNGAQKVFFDNNMIRDEVYEVLSLSHNTVGLHLTKVEIPDGFPRPKGAIYMYSKKEVYAIRDSNAFIQNNGISTYNARKYLDVTELIFRAIIKESDIETKRIVGGNGKYYLKDDIERIRVKQNEFWDGHISPSEIKELYKTNVNISITFKEFESYEVPNYAKSKTLFVGTGNQFYCYKKNALLKKIYSLNNKRNAQGISGETYFDTFKLRVDVYADELTKFNLSIYTKEKWFDFVDSKLNETQQY